MALQTSHSKQSLCIAMHNTHVAMIYLMDERKWREGKKEKVIKKSLENSSLAGVVAVDASLG